MDQVRIGRAVRSLRRRRRWRQVDLAEAAGVSRSAVSLIEGGGCDRLTLTVLRRVCVALGAELAVLVRWHGEGLDRLLDETHAGLVELVVSRLQRAGWETQVEVSFNVRGERGSIDVFARRADALGLALVVEVKSVIPDEQAMLHALDRKVRLAPIVGRGLGWEVRRVARLLVVGESRTSRRRIEAHSATYAAAFPMRGRQLSRWLRSPDDELPGVAATPVAAQPPGAASTRHRLAGLLFLSPVADNGVRRVAGGRHRVRRPSVSVISSGSNVEAASTRFESGPPPAERQPGRPLTGTRAERRPNANQDRR